MAQRLSSLAIMVGAGVLASLPNPSLAQPGGDAATAVVLDGPPPTLSASQGAPRGLASLVSDQAGACGLDPAALTVRQETFTAAPRTPEEEAALEESIDRMAAIAGLSGPKGDRQASRMMIRGLLTVRLRLRLEYAGAQAADAAGMACLVESLGAQGFTPAAPPESEPAPAPAFTQAKADAIADACGAPRAWLLVEPGGAVRFAPPVGADDRVVFCILQRIRESGVTRFGFVGNDKPRPEDGTGDD